MLRFTEIDKKTVQLMEFYEHLVRDYSGKHFELFKKYEDPRKNMYFDNFKGLIAESLQDRSSIPDPREWIVSQFKMLEINCEKKDINCPPSFLFSEYAVCRYSNYIQDKEICENNISIPETDNDIKSEIKKSFDRIKKMNNKRSGKNIYDMKLFLSFQHNKYLIWHDVISKYLLSCSKYFFNHIKLFEYHFKIDIYKHRVDSSGMLVSYTKELIKNDYRE